MVALYNKVRPKAAYSSLRFVLRTDRILTVRNGVVEPPRTAADGGAMATVFTADGGYGYGASAALNAEGLTKAFDQAQTWAGVTAKFKVPGISSSHFETRKGTFKRLGTTHWEDRSLKEKIDRLRAIATALGQGPDIVDHEVSLLSSHVTQVLVTSSGSEIIQEFEYLTPTLSATAFRNSVSETRSFVGGAYTRQGGLELLDAIGLEKIAEILPEEARMLVAAPQCPTGDMDLILDPDQMILQIHESIGHPLELDRILGDERNYAGTSFVTADMFGSYQYGSEHLNISFDPRHEGEVASYAYDDEGTLAEKAYLIENGRLVRGLGGLTSQQRALLSGVPSTRATSWNRPPIDRMANLNLEPGDQSLEQLIAQVEHGVYMKTNCSWSIDDSRNKFQFGCEWGQLIEHGKLGKVVRKPNYRGISANFWRSLKAVGDATTVDILGTLNCGKGEPNQAIQVGHASPACLFSGVTVFGGES